MSDLRKTVGVFGFILVTSGLPTQAQTPDPNEPMVSLAGQIELARLVDTVAQRLKLNIEYDASLLKFPVTLRLEGGLTDEELWLLVNRALAARGFTTVRQCGVGGGMDGGKASYSIVKLTDAAGAAAINLVDRPIVQGELTPGFQSLVVRAKHRPAKDLVEQLGRGGARPGGAGAGGPGGGAISTIGDSGLILISDLSPRIEQVMTLLNLLDTPASHTVVEEVPIHNLPAAQLVTLLLQLSGKKDAVSGEKSPGDILAAPDGNAVLLVAPQSGLESWKSLITTLDRREPVETQTYTPRHFPANDVARLIEQTVVKGSGGSVGGAGAAGSDPRWKLVVDDLTGSLIVTATPTQQDAIQALLTRLDSVPASARRPMRTFVVKNRSATEVAATLEQLLRAGVLDAADESANEANKGSVRSPGGLEAAYPKLGKPEGNAPTVIPLPPLPSGSGATGPNPSSLIGSRSVESSDSQFGHFPDRHRGGSSGAREAGTLLTVDKGTNTLIVVAEPRVLDQIETLLKTLDVRQPQVMLDVLLLTLNEGQTLDLGVELEKLVMSGDTLLRLSSLFGLGSRGSGGDRAGPDNASGFTGVVLNPGDFSVVVRALETLNRGRSLTMPKLLVGNNEQATLDSVVQQPFASVNASNTVSTTSFGGTQDAGTVVTIQPQIAQGDHLLLQYSVSLSSFLGSAASPTLPPARQQNRVQSVATIPDGFTVVVGGIDIQNKSNTISQVPLLGSIPIIGEVFKSRNNADSRSRFYVFIRANIMRNQSFEDLKYVSGREVVAAQVDDGWPEVKPRVIR